MGKRIGAIVSVTIIGILIIATIIMANINVDYRIRCATPDAIYVQYGSNTEHVTTEEQESRIIDLINNASKGNALEALFSGNLFGKAEITTVRSTINNSTSSTTPTTSGNFYITYHYNTPQVLKYGNDDYIDSHGTVYYYKELVFEVSNQDGESDFSVYIRPYYTETTSTSNTGTAYTGTGYAKRYTLSANFTDLYNYLNDTSNGFNQ